MEKESIVLRYRIRGVKEEMPYREGGGLELSYRKLSYVIHRIKRWAYSTLELSLMMNVVILSLLVSGVCYTRLTNHYMIYRRTRDDL